MGHKILLLLMLLLGCISPVLWAAPTLVVETPEQDFGTVVEGEQVVTTFRFQNVGDQLLEIGNVQVSCGCTAALLSARRLAPGAGGELQVTFDSRGFRGKVQKTVSFSTNDPDHPQVSMYLKGQVKALFYHEPQRVYWGRVAPGDDLQEKIIIYNASERMISLEQPRLTVQGVRAELSSTSVPPGGQVELKLATRIGQEVKRLAGYVLITTDFPSVPQIRVPFSARIATQ